MGERYTPNGYRRKQPCGHKFLVECPLTPQDWEAVFFAQVAFREFCRMVSNAAHLRVSQQEECVDG